MEIAEQEFTEDWRWQAVVQKDASTNGIFFFAVKTTGIFCRPSCSSRTPNKENVRYFYSREDAVNAGFRPCKRCKPDAEGNYSPQAELISNALRLLNNDSMEVISVGELSSRLGISSDKLQRVFKRSLGLNPKQIIELSKIDKFKGLVKDLSVTDAAYESGFGSSRALYEKAAEKIGMTPANYKKGGAGLSIGYTFIETPIGKMLVAATDKGICSAAFGENEAELLLELKKEFFAADLAKDEHRLADIAAAVESSFDGKRDLMQLPLDVRGTAFQLSVWSELRNIPFGKTATYSEIAAKLGNPKAFRAVARACATNPAAVITPCHRVIASNGSLSGFKWGIDKKAKLLAAEKELSESK